MSSAFAPLGVRVFRLLWIAGLVSNIGSWMQTVGAQWLLVEQGSPASVVALVQTAAAAPVLLLALPAGVLGEFFNRRTLLIVVQTAQFLIVLGLAWLTWAGAMTPALLLAVTFLLGAGSALQLPAYQAVVPDVVPAPMIADAAVLSSIGVNVARAIGPALAGLVVAQLGVTAVFVANALSFLVFLIALFAWRGYTPKRGRPERFLDATRAGLRYVRNAGAIRGLYLRLALFLLPANGLWALLPVLASTELHLDAGGYGLLLASLGVGSVAGAFLLPPLRARWSTGTIVAVASAVFGVCILVVALTSLLWVVLVVLVIAGFAWIGVIATINGTVQSFLPVWVRTRGLSIYQLVLFGSTAVGAAATGALASWVGVVGVLLGCGALLVVLGIVGALRPAIDTRDKGRAIVTMPLTDVPLVQGEEPDDLAATPVLVLIRYAVAAERRDEFAQRMDAVGRSRRRTGARDWRLYTDREDPAVLVEAFQVGSWSEHLSQHEERMTEYDRQLLDRARALADGEPVVEHLLEAEVVQPRRR
ncbi:MFS transporter [Leifsonia sp. TF02-11]|uniref:MFS transporter n=1 Tax=Leifsonia sp. TF02-11 TaxID=2815212 RepID=UPI001AA1C808|nr:MFS transporter [Leifsonia sp. TF02-11]MBO1741318.1 MFS transporter [Leifsonia sp. TF02-11]